MFMPPGFTTLTPYLIVKDADAYLEFLINAFAAEEVGTSRRPDGSIANSQIRIGNAMLMLTQSDDFLKVMPAAYYLYVEDADAAMAKAIEHGASVIMPVDDMPYQDRQGGVKDPQGNIWWLSQRLVEGPYTN